MKPPDRDRSKRVRNDAASDHDSDEELPLPVKKKPSRPKKAVTSAGQAFKKVVTFLSPVKAKPTASSTKSRRPSVASTTSSAMPSLRSVTNSDATSFGFNDASSVAASSVAGMPALQSISSRGSSVNAMDVDSIPNSPGPRRTSVEDAPESDEELRETHGPGRRAHRYLIEADDVIEINHTPSPEPEIVELTDEQELEKWKKGLRSPIYAFFRPEVDIEYRVVKGSKHPQKHYMFSCAARGCKHRVPRNLETKDRTSSKNLKQHAEKCWGKDTVRAALDTQDLDQARGLVKKHGQTKNGRLTDMFSKLKRAGAEVFSHIPLSKPATRAECVRWVSESYRPFNVVKDRGFNRLMKTGRPETYIPHPTTVSRDTKVLFAKTRKRLAKQFQRYNGRISIGTDAWTSPNHRAFVAYTAHWQEEGQPVNAVLDFRELAESHSGEALAKLTEDVVREFGIEKKLLSVTCDNASPNDVMIKHLGEALPYFDGPDSRTRCFAHVVNLVAKSLLKLFDAPKRKKRKGKKGKTTVQDDDDDDDDAGAEDSNTVEDEEIDIVDLLSQLKDLELGAGEEKDDVDDVFDELAELSEEAKEKFLTEIQAVSLALKKIRHISFAVINSPTILLPRWNELVAEAKLPPKRLPRDVSTRWNSTFDMLNVAIQYQRVVRDIAGEESLSNYSLNRVEWTTLENLRDVLQAFKDATLFFSRDNATLASVIPAMDKLDDLLATAVICKDKGKTIELSAPVKAALLMAKNTLNRYYTLSDDSALYRIAIVMHPRYKLTYFDEKDWPASWKDAARELVERAYQDYQDAYDEFVGEQDNTPAPSTSTSAPSGNMFDALEDEPISTGSTRLVNDLQAYLAAPRVSGIKNVLAWWIENQERYPVLSRMALDYLTIPPTSVAVERTFSKGRLLLSHIRNRLSAQTARALMCLGSWSLMGLVHDEDIKQVTNLPQVDEKEGNEDGDILFPDDYDAIGTLSEVEDDD